MTVEKLILPKGYEYVDTIGNGGFATVIKAKGFGENEVAIKILDVSKIKYINIERFKREIKIHNMLNHENIVPILDFNTDEDEGIIYYTMPLAIRNFTEELAEYRKDILENNMDDDMAAYYFEKILDAVEYAHSEGVIHRDLKPQNIFIFEDEILKIGDFGLGKFIDRDTTSLTKTKVSVGTECYSAPEQYQEANAKNVDERADVYSLGKILYEIITFDLPVVIDNEKLGNSKFKLLINKATKYNKEKRFSSVSEMRKMFDLLRGGNISFRSSGRNFTKLYKKYLEDKNEIVIKDIVEILLENQNDYKLYTENFMELDSGILQAMNNNFKSEFNEIIEAYLRHIDTLHTFSFTDIIAKFLIEILDIIDDFDIYENIIDVLLRLAYNHNRFYVGEVLAKYIGSLKESDVEKLLIISEVLNKNNLQTNWLKTYLLAYGAEDVLYCGIK